MGNEGDGPSCPKRFVTIFVISTIADNSLIYFDRHAPRHALWYRDMDGGPVSSGNQVCIKFCPNCRPHTRAADILAVHRLQIDSLANTVGSNR
jgi:hypothetical protein